MFCICVCTHTSVLFGVSDTLAIAQNTKHTCHLIEHKHTSTTAKTILKLNTGKQTKRSCHCQASCGWLAAKNTRSCSRQGPNLRGTEQGEQEQGDQTGTKPRGAADPNKWILILNRWSHKIRSACRYVVKIQPSDKWLLDKNMIKEELLRQRNIREISQAQEAAALIFPWNVFLKVFLRHKWAISP